MTDTTAVITPKWGWLGRWRARRRLKKAEEAQRTVEWITSYHERVRVHEAKVERFNTQTPKELIEQALVMAGLPPDIAQVQGRTCVYSIPRGGKSEKGCVSARIAGIGLNNGELGLTFEDGRHNGYPDIWYSGGGWYVGLKLGDQYASHPIHDFSLV